MRKIFENLTRRPILGYFVFTILLNALIIVKINSMLNPIIDFNDFRESKFNLTNLFFDLSAATSFYVLIFCAAAKFLRRLKIFATLIAIFSAAFYGFEFFTIEQFDSKFSIFILDAMLRTNANETAEFIQTFFSFKILLFAGATAGAFWLLGKLTLKFSEARYKIWLAFCGVCVAGAVWGAASNANFNNFEKNTLVRFACVISGYFSSDNYIKNLENLAAAYENSYQKNLAAIGEVKSKNLPKNVVLIIGESLQRNYMSLYGYDKPTTPRLDALKNSPNLIVFSDVVSPFTATNPSLQRVLNFSNFDSKIAWFESLNLIDMFKIAGFKSAWVSNQDRFDVKSSSATSVSNRADVVKFPPTLGDYYWESLAAKTDEAVLDLLPKLDGERKFYVVHLMGNHMSYSKRYPAEFGKFSEADVENPKLDATQRKIVSQYLNSVLYNDFVVSEIFKRFAGEDSLVIYLSDHAESLYEYKNKLGHGFASRFTCEIPMIIYGSDEFIAAHPKIWAALSAAKDAPFMSDDLAHALADIIGVKPLEYDAARSLISGEFNASRKRIVQDVDYEKMRRQKAYE